MGTWTFGYDALNRITGATNTSAGITGSILSPQTYCYDSFGNRWPGTVSNAACVPGGANTFAPNNQVQPGFAYDLAGNVIANQNFGLGTDTYTWDSENRLQSVNASTFYQYDAEGRRVAKGTVSSSGVFTPTAEYLYGDDTATELDGSGNWKRTDVNAAGRLLATYNPAGLHYQLADWLGTRRVQTTAAGVPEETCISYPFGDGPTCSGTDATGSRYTGKERDSESGLDYFGARYNASSMGRFTSPDPGWFFASRLENPQTWNQYSYVLNNPLSFTDPDGYDCVYLNDAGNGVESVDPDSNGANKADCMGDGKNNKGTGGFWIDGTATQVTLYTNSDDVGLSGQKDDGTLTAAAYGHSPVDSQDPDMATFGQQGYQGYVPPGFKMTFDPYPTRLFGTHWCGPGGGGVPVNALDAACKAHDQCFDAAGISAASNDGGGHMTLQQASAASTCNAALGAAAAAHPEIPGSTRISEWLKHGDQLLVLTGGRIDGHLAGGTATR